MKPAAEIAPPCVYLLADHLDSALAAGEDLPAASFAEGCREQDCHDGWSRERSRERMAEERAHCFELTLIARLLAARERAAELATFDGRFQSLARLFVASLVPLADAAAELADASATDFETGGGVAAYLRSRGLLDNDDAAHAERRAFKVSDTFLVAGRLELGVLLDLAATFLDTLERYYDLYPVEDRSAEAAAETQSGGAEAAAA